MSDSLAEQMKRLQTPFGLEVVSFKPQTVNGAKTSAMVTTFIDARAVVSRLDEVFPLAWADEYEVMEHTADRLTIECKLTLYLDGRTITRRDVGESTNKDDGKAASRWKSAMSDAFKRAAVKFGVGAYLYGLENVWVEVREAGRSVKLTPNGLRTAESAYVRAVKALGLTTTSERSQGQVDATDESAETPEPLLNRKRADAMKLELGKLGYNEVAQQKLAMAVAGRKFADYTEMTETTALEVWNLARRSKPQQAAN